MALCFVLMRPFAQTGWAQMASAPAAATELPAGLLPLDRVEKILPQTVFFKDQSAPLQLRNAAAFHTASGNTIWASLVDSSGYSTGVRERYQFYFVTEAAITVAGKNVPAGAYGGGFLSDGTFLLMDIGGNDIFRVPVVTDSAMHRPRPLQMVPGPDGVRLYLGRQYVAITAR